MKYFNDVGTFVIVAAFLFIAVIYTPIDSGNDLLGYAFSPIYSGYAVPISSIVVDNNVNFASSTDTIQKTVDATDDIVYRQAYISYDGVSWTPLNLSPSGTGTLNGNWIYGRGFASITFTPAKLNLSASRNYSNNTFIIIYSCSKNTTIHNWSCHDGWQIIPFNARLNSSSSTTITITKTPSHPYISEVSTNNYDIAYNTLPEFTIDSNLTGESRWSGEGNGAWIRYAFKNNMQLVGINILFYKSSSRIARFSLEYSMDDKIWAKIGDYSSSGTAASFETFSFNTIIVKYFRIIGHGNTEVEQQNFTSIIEVQFINNTQATCIPKTCASFGYNCGTWSDGCVGTLNCGTNCPIGQTCTGGICTASAITNLSGLAACYSQGYNCGTLSGVSCGICPNGLTCNANNLCVSPGKTLFVATYGNDNNNGDIAHPYATLEKAWSYAAAGDMIYMRGGNFRYTDTINLEGKSGSLGKMIYVWNYPGEHPAINYSGVNFGSQTQCFGIFLRNNNYLYLKGLRVTGAAQVNEPYAQPNYGMILWDGVDNSIFEQMETDHIGGWGVVIGDNSDNNLFLNCDSHHNADPYSTGDPYGGADGFQTGSHGSIASTNNIFRGCRSWSNSDDGWDLRQSDGVYTIENCWSFNNGYNGGNGEGFKMGPKTNPGTTSILRTVRNCLAFGNIAGASPGGDAELAPFGVGFYNNVMYDNQLGFNFEYNDAGSIVRNNIVYANKDNMYGWSSSITHDHNTLDSSVTVTDADFLSLDSFGADGPRQADGSLPNIQFLHLAPGSDLINAGIPIAGRTTDGYGNTIVGNPDIGAYEYH